MRSYSSLELLFVLSGVLFATCNAFATNEFWALTTFKEAIYEDPHLVLSNWNALDADPCHWTGIACSDARDRVLKINISGSSLKGFLAPELGLLTYLQELILHGNNLIGIIPKELGLLKRLKILDLGANQLTGPIPPEIGNLTGLVKINLQSNGLTGRLPAELGNLISLEELHLDRNRLQGAVPAGSNSGYTANIHGMYASSANLTGLCHLSQLKVADFSYNFFVGSIPKCLEYLPSTSFQGNCLRNKDPKQRATTLCGGAPPARTRAGLSPKHQAAEDVSKHQSASRPAWLLTLEIVTGTMVGVLFLVAGFTGLQRCKSKPFIIIPWKKSASEKDHIYIDSEILKDVVRFSRQELEVACEDFSNIIGSSPDSLVYKMTAS